MTDEMMDVADTIEYELCNLDYARTVLEEASYDLSPVITFDKSKEDNNRISSFLNRRKKIFDFVYIALDYIDKTKENLQAKVEQIHKESRGGGHNLIEKKGVPFGASFSIGDIMYYLYPT